MLKDPETNVLVNFDPERRAVFEKIARAIDVEIRQYKVFRDLTSSDEMIMRSVFDEVLLRCTCGAGEGARHEVSCAHFADSKHDPSRGFAILCGVPSPDYDASLVSNGRRCPHCGAVGELDFSYGLAAGGIGSYRICEACERYCDYVEDLEGKKNPND